MNAPRITLQDLTDKFLRQYQTLPPQSFQNWKNAAYHLVRYGAKEALSRDFVRGWMKYTSDNLAANTCNRVRSRVRTFFRWLADNRYTSIDYHSGIEWSIAYQKKIRRLVSAEDFEKLRDSAETESLRWAIVLGYWTGMSWVDVCTLKWEHIDWDHLMIRKVRYKVRGRTSIDATVPILEAGELHGELLRRKDITGGSPDGYVHPELAGRLLTECVHDSYEFTRLARRCGFKDTTFTSFRNTVCTRLANDEDVNPEIARRLTGHSNYQQLLKYATKQDDVLRQHLSRHLAAR